MAIKCSCPNCDRKYTLADSMDGKKIRCKDCEKTFTVEEADDRTMSADDNRRKRSGALASKSSRRDDDDDDRPRRRSRDDDEDEEEDGPPKKRKKGGAPVGLLIGGGVGLLLVVGVVILLVVLLGGNSKLTAENVAKVKMGMTEKEVIDLIGSPNETVDAKKAVGNAPKTGSPFDQLADEMTKALGDMLPKTMTWKNGKDINFTITFLGGKVSGIVGQLGTPVASNTGKDPAPQPQTPSPKPGPQPTNPNPFGPNPFGPNPAPPTPAPQPNPPPTPPILPNPSPAPTGSKFTLDNIGKLRVGMSEQEITDLIGKPTLTPDVGNGKRLMTYIGKGAVQVHLKDGKAEIIDASWDGKPITLGGTGPNPQPSAGAFTRENVNKLKIGMSEQEVIDLIGKPVSGPYTLPSFDPKAPKTTAAGWNSKVGTVQIQWVDGKTSLIGGNFDGKLFNITDTGPGPNPNPNPNPQPEGNKFTKENVNKLKIGMSEQAVIDLIGKPVSGPFANPSLEPNAPKKTTAGWRGADGVLQVEWVDGKAKVIGGQIGGVQVNVTDNGPNPNPNPDPNQKGQFTVANLNKLAVGMTEGEVIALLGQPTTTDTQRILVAPRVHRTVKFLIYQNPMGGIAKLPFVDGKYTK